MKVSIAVDFTLSNLEIDDYRSLHRLNKGDDMNQYQRAIFEVCNVMTPHAADGKFYVYGFGGIPKYLDQTEVSRLWSLNTNQEDPSCEGTMAVLQAYQAAIEGSELAGPSYFGPLLKRIKSEIVESIEDTGIEDNKLYHLAIIITDGNCHDMAETKR